jgi:hypothetical protein
MKKYKKNPRVNSDISEGRRENRARCICGIYVRGRKVRALKRPFLL